MLRATRAMKARRTHGICPLCTRVMRCGELICKVGQTWLHTRCWRERR